MAHSNRIGNASYIARHGADAAALADLEEGATRLTRRQFSVAAETIVHVVLKGCGIRRDARSRGRHHSQRR